MNDDEMIRRLLEESDLPQDDVLEAALQRPAVAVAR